MALNRARRDGSFERGEGYKEKGEPMGKKPDRLVVTAVGCVISSLSSGNNAVSTLSEVELFGKAIAVT